MLAILGMILWKVLCSLGIPDKVTFVVGIVIIMLFGISLMFGTKAAKGCIGTGKKVVTKGAKSVGGMLNKLALKAIKVVWKLVTKVYDATKKALVARGMNPIAAEIIAQLVRMLVIILII